jgi:hypothetical protein
MPAYSEADEGSGDSGVMAPTGPSRDAVKRLDQIIQVLLPISCRYMSAVLTWLMLELPYESSHRHITVSNVTTSRYHE